MTEGYICVGADERAEMNLLAGGYRQVVTFVEGSGTLCLYTVRLGYMRTDGLETAIKGSTLGVCEIHKKVRL
jgi:hypothetical protein